MVIVHYQAQFNINAQFETSSCGLFLTCKRTKENINYYNYGIAPELKKIYMA
jgi:hypothetical protein